MAKKKTRREPPAQQQAPVIEQTVGKETAAPKAKAAPYRKEEPAAKPAPWWLPLLLEVGFFLMTMFTSTSTIKPLVLVLIVAGVVSCLVRLSAWGKRFTWPVLAVCLWVLMNGISMFYAASGKFALREFLKIMVGFCVFEMILAWGRAGKDKGRVAASVLEGAAALAGLFSIDALSTHWLCMPLINLMNKFSTDYIFTVGNAVEPGVRMNSLYENPNVFAGVAGLGILLALGLSVTTEGKWERRFHLACLFVNSLAFLLAFSMGASAVIALAFLVFLFLERRERKGALLVLMVETFLLALAAAFPIFLTSFDNWSGFQPIPLLCAVGGAVLLCAADQFLGRRIGTRLENRGKTLAVVIAAVLVLLAAFGALSVTVTGPATLDAGESLRRASYPAPGSYALTVDATAPMQVTVTSQNQAQTMMHTNTVLYSGSAEGAAFTVPEDSLVVYFDLRAEESGAIRSATYAGANGNGSLKLDYKLLPGFIANRLQGLFANQNAIQRTVFFADGMKLFRESPIIGQGLGTFENGVRRVQSFDYETKYTHNHYIETLLSTGIIGLVLFVGMLALCGVALWKNRRREDGSLLTPALAAALVFMAGHGAVEVIFSTCYYLPMAIGVLALICLCCGEELPFLPEKQEVRKWMTVGVAVLMLVFSITLYLNMKARDIATHSTSDTQLTNLERADKLDLYEWTDYELTYVYAARGIDPESQSVIYEKANAYAAHLSKVRSNSIPPYLAEYYFTTGQRELAYQVLEQFVDYVSASSETWQTAFDLMMTYSEGTEAHRAELARLYEKFQTWNADHMGSLTLTESEQVYLDAMLGD